MADDSVPLPYPNLKVPQWYYQLSSVPRLKEEASTSFWKAIEADGQYPSMRYSQADWKEMAPYLRFIESTNSQLLETLHEKNEKQLKEFEDKLKQAEEKEGESEISDLLRKKAMYLVRIGDKVSLLPAGL